MFIVIMFNYVTLCSFLCLCVQCKCDYYIREGSSCGGVDNVQGTCVNEKRCYSALDNKKQKLPRCLETEEGKSVVCCSDCELVDDTSKAVISPTGGTYWKTRNKARNNCLQYLKDLPYKCRERFEGGVERVLDEENQCHKVHNWTKKIDNMELKGTEYNEMINRNEYPHQALLGYGDTLETADWLAGGSVISDRFILSAAHVGGHQGQGELTFVALGVLSVSNPSAWQVHKVKRFIKHPTFYERHSYYDIALIETETQIKFTENVLPACLPVEKNNVIEAVATTWWDLNEEGRVFADTIQTIKHIEPFPEEICNSTYKTDFQNYQGFNKKIQMCFASKKYPSDSCRGLSGEPLLINNQISSCLYTIIGVTSFGAPACGPTEELSPEVYTRVSFFVPWIESVVWP